MESESVRRRLDYLYTMDHINTMRKLNEKPKPIAGSFEFGLQYANFYYDKINKMLEKEHVDMEVLKELQSLVHIDLKKVRADAKERVANSFAPEFTYVQTKKNDGMMSMIMDFIATLPPASIVDCSPNSPC